MREPAPATRSKLTDYTAVIRQRDANGTPFVIVGGQAVNFWADFFSLRAPDLRGFLPFTSKDLDLVGTAQEALRVAEEIQWQFDPAPADALVMQGILSQGHLRVEFIQPQSQEIFLPVTVNVEAFNDTISIRVLSPVTLFVKKLTLAIDVPQDGFEEIAPRQDVRHAQMLALCLPHYIEDLCGKLPAAASKHQTIEPIVAVLASVKRRRIGQRFEAVYPRLINWSRLLPPQVDALDLSAVHQRCLAELNQRSSP